MIRAERMEKVNGNFRYVVDLRGPLDGHKLEINYKPDCEIESQLSDMAGGEQGQSLKYYIGKRHGIESNKDELVLHEMAVLAVGKETFWDETNRILHIQDLDLKNELKLLTFWWLTETRALPIVYGHEEWKTNDIRLKRTEDWLGERRMEKFYGGEELVIGENLAVKVEFDDSPANGWDVSLGIHDDFHNVHVGWIDGAVRLCDDGEAMLTIGAWKSTHPDIDLTNHVLALLLKFLHNRVGVVSVMHQETLIKMDKVDIDKLSKLWLGF